MARTTQIRMAVAEGSGLCPKGQKILTNILRDKFAKEANMPEDAKKTKKKAAKKAKKKSVKKAAKTKTAKKEEMIAGLRTEIADLKKQLNALDSLLRKEHNEATAKKRAEIYAKLKAKVALAASALANRAKVAAVKVYDVVRHPVETGKKVRDGVMFVGGHVRDGACFVGSHVRDGASYAVGQIKRPFSFIASKFHKEEEPESEGSVAPQGA